MYIVQSPPIVSRLRQSIPSLSYLRRTLLPPFQQEAGTSSRGFVGVRNLEWRLCLTGPREPGHHRTGEHLSHLRHVRSSFHPNAEARSWFEQRVKCHLPSGVEYGLGRTKGIWGSKMKMEVIRGLQQALQKSPFPARALVNCVKVYGAKQSADSASFLGCVLTALLAGAAAEPWLWG